LRVVNNYDKNKVEEFIFNHSKGHFMQSYKWARMKSNWKNEVLVVLDDNDNIKGVMSILIRTVPLVKRTIMYCPRGPVMDIHDSEVLNHLIKYIRDILAKKYRAYIFKMDPDIEIEDKEFLELVKKMGFKIRADAKNFEGIQPRFVFRLDIKNKTQDEVFNQFHSKTRYNIRLAMKKGVEVKIGNKNDLEDFHKIMIETGVRDKFVIRSLGYFQKMYDIFAPDNLRLYMAYYNGQPIAGTIAILYGNKCWYLYGASSNQYRNVMPNYLLQWEMIKWAIENKCDIYDFRGVSGDISEDNPLYGLYRFKKGFGGKFTEFVGELDLVFSPSVYYFVKISEKVFKSLRRTLFVLKNRKVVSSNETSDN